MGGNAFLGRLSATAFPRLPPPVYRALKARLFPLIQQQYIYVGVPEEDPDKLDHGDLDFIVTQPRDSNITLVAHKTIQDLFNASDFLAANNNPTANFAVPVEDGEWAKYGLLDLEREYRTRCDDGKIYYQVDVHVCPDHVEWQYILYIHSYGYLNDTLAHLARKNGLSFGGHGLKVEVAKKGNYLRLTYSFEEILRFFGLSFDTYNSGFSTREEVFKWLTTSKYFDATLFYSDLRGPRKDKDRLNAFFDFIAQLPKSASTTSPVEDPAARKKRVVDEALSFFGKHQAYHEKWAAYEKFQEDRRLAQERMSRRRKLWSGNRVNDWAEMNNDWVGVKNIMDAVRVQLGDDETITNLMEEQGEERVRSLVVQIKTQLGSVTRKSEEQPRA